ncbi:MAG: HNH endonuclease [Gammaproteobacteria bacterium]|nr:HNH endonuclease [Gammaproteobacteria bacterium]
MLAGEAIPLILTLDNAGRPIDWLNWKEAINLYVREQVAWTASETRLRFYGGTCQKTGLTSFLDLSTIIAIRGAKPKFNHDITPPLTNRALFERDKRTCLYCGSHFKLSLLTRDHVKPRAQGGKDTWINVVTACKSCNVKKACNTPSQAHMPLLALPYAPNKAEAMILANRKILTDQMDFLRNHIPHERREEFD